MSRHADNLLLGALPSDQWDRPVPLLKAGDLVAKLVGDPVDPSTLHRWRTRGIDGVRLPVLRVGAFRYVTPRMLAEFFVACGNEESRARHTRKKRRARRMVNSAATLGGNDAQA